MGHDGSFSIINLFLQFSDLGAEWVMWLLIGLGVLMGGLFLERLFLYLRTQVNAPGIARELVMALSQGKVKEAAEMMSRGRAMEERVLADALEVYEQGAFVIEQVMMSSLAREKQRFDRFLDYFGTLGNNAPFIGLFGTVIGIIISFKKLGENPKGGLEVVGPGIAEALVATAVGLLVAIPAVVAYNWLKGSMKKRVSNTEFLGRIILSQSQHGGEAAPAPAP
ncbi:MotA/TolQ/ExbB proton channel family protein, partial [Myxococcota bacterium]|nr:MotA/TolQ/ExbB proton channel family protein [Myxococcota bacterium]